MHPALETSLLERAPSTADRSAFARDTQIQKRVTLQVVNALAAVVLAILILEFNYRSQQHAGLEALKWLLLGCSLAYWAQLYDYYRLWAGEGRPVKHGQLALEVLVSLPCPLPDAVLHMDDNFALAVFLRLYVLVRLAHYFSPVHLYRTKLLEHTAALRERFGDAAVESMFGAQFTLKLYFFRRPGKLLLALFTLVFFTMSYAIYARERQTQPEVFNLTESMWFVSTTLTTVGYGDLYPEDTLGRVLSCITCVSGIAMLSLAVVVVTDKLQCNPAEERLMHHLEQYRAPEERRARIAEVPPSSAGDAPDVAAQLAALAAQLTEVQRVQGEILAKLSSSSSSSS